MKTLRERAKLDNKIMGLMKVNEIHHIIAKTDKGELSLMLRKGGTEKDYRFVLDAVPYEDEQNKELMGLFKDTLFIE